MHSEGPVAALKMALSKYTEADQQLIHHSDRGMQYCCHEYIKLLKNITISMTHEGDPGENAIAEQINGTIKNEFYCRGFLSFQLVLLQKSRENKSSFSEIEMAVQLQMG